MVYTSIVEKSNYRKHHYTKQKHVKYKSNYSKEESPACQIFPFNKCG